MLHQHGCISYLLSAPVAATPRARQHSFIRMQELLSSGCRCFNVAFTHFEHVLIFGGLPHKFSISLLVNRIPMEDTSKASELVFSPHLAYISPWNDAQCGLPALTHWEASQSSITSKIVLYFGRKLHLVQR